MRRLVCRIRGHVVGTGWATIPGITFFTPCRRCGRIVEQECRVKSYSGATLRVIR